MLCCLQRILFTTEINSCSLNSLSFTQVCAECLTTVPHQQLRKASKTHLGGTKQAYMKNPNGHQNWKEITKQYNVLSYKNRQTIQTTFSLSQDKYDGDLFLIHNEIIQSFKPTVSTALWYHDETITEIPSTDRYVCLAAFHECIPTMMYLQESKQGHAPIVLGLRHHIALGGVVVMGSLHRPKVATVKKNTDSLFLLCFMFLNVLFAKLLKLHFQIAFGKQT